MRLATSTALVATWVVIPNPAPVLGDGGEGSAFHFFHRRKILRLQPHSPPPKLSSRTRPPFLGTVVRDPLLTFSRAQNSPRNRARWDYPAQSARSSFRGATP